MPEQTIFSRSENETSALAATLLDILRPGDCLCLSGPVGAGKSHFARSLIQSQMTKDGHIEDVPSPTFTLVQVYDTAIGEIWHADLYRLTSVDAVLELGLEDAFDTAITLIEWADRLGPFLPERRLEIDISLAGASESDETHRDITLRPVGSDWRLPAIGAAAA